eukprot:gnl/MRDRNA2_/MRDRNA2_155505_c0_seq1.p1 gnl/MRDRNA2_/MRDRNA2_155505_c0~~gnl/MRDRNA2_/MRDRNA2_155505_c0_seq1.p1  ORF type:complete len:129 (+),score=13.11 gnl/MRDRNA2_/MRDRNA2_155505_c0_seq1:116-502(+)
MARNRSVETIYNDLNRSVLTWWQRAGGMWFLDEEGEVDIEATRFRVLQPGQTAQREFLWTIIHQICVKYHKTDDYLPEDDRHHWDKRKTMGTKYNMNCKRVYAAGGQYVYNVSNMTAMIPTLPEHSSP